MTDREIALFKKWERYLMRDEPNHSLSGCPTTSCYSSGGDCQDHFRHTDEDIECEYCKSYVPTKTNCTRCGAPYRKSKS